MLKIKGASPTARDAGISLRATLTCRFSFGDRLGSCVETKSPTRHHTRPKFYNNAKNSLSLSSGNFSTNKSSPKNFLSLILA